MTKLLYQGHGSLRLTTGEGKVIYIDPYLGEGYGLPADLILVSHQHHDHNRLDLIANRNPGCQIFSNHEAIVDGKHKTFSFPDKSLTAEAVEARNKNHDPKECVGFILTFSDGVQLYLSCDTSNTAQMATFKNRNIDYAFFCCDGVYNMDAEEASECAAIVGARRSAPYHMIPGGPFDMERAEKFQTKGRLIIKPGEEIELRPEA